MPVSNTDPSFLRVHRLAADISARRMSPLDIVEALLSRIEAHNPKLHAFIDAMPTMRGSPPKPPTTIRSGHAVDLPCADRAEGSDRP
jgi:aspartyl-tRNA(Asn)/glutamyl-tRNA(Gln) amidotransferase subunit A